MVGHSMQKNNKKHTKKQANMKAPPNNVYNGWGSKNGLSLTSYCFILTRGGVYLLSRGYRHLMAILYLKGFNDKPKSSCSFRPIGKTHFFEK